MKKAILISVLLLSMLQGCGVFTPMLKKDAIITEKTVQVDPKALEPCAPLVPRAASAPDPFAAILDNVDANAKIYADCASKQDTSITLLKKFSNTKETK